MGTSSRQVIQICTILSTSIRYVVSTSYGVDYLSLLLTYSHVINITVIHKYNTILNTSIHSVVPINYGIDYCNENKFSSSYPNKYYPKHKYLLCCPNKLQCKLPISYADIKSHH